MRPIGLRTVLACGLIAAATTAVGFESPSHTTDSLQAVREHLDAKKAVLIDVREEKEWKRGHLAEAILVPLSAIGGPDAPAAVEKKLAEKKQIIYCHCASGHRVLLAAEKLRAMGYSEVRPLREGYAKLVAAGFKVAGDEKASEP